MTPEEIRKIVEVRLQLDLSSKSRKRELVYGRAVYFKLCKDLTRVSLHSIGKIVGRDHATVLHGLNLFDNVIDTGYEPFLKKVYKAIKRKLTGEIAHQALIQDLNIKDVRLAMVTIEERLRQMEQDMADLMS